MKNETFDKNSKRKKPLQVVKPATTTIMLQNTLLNSTESYDDVTSLFPNNYVTPFMLEGHDLINNSSLHITNVMEQLYKVLKLPLSNSTLLDTLYALIVNNHLITSFKDKDKTRLIRKAYLCILNYILIIRFTHIIKNILPKLAADINIIHSNIVSIFSSKNYINNFFQLELTEYSPEVSLQYKESLASLTYFIGQSYKALKQITIIFKENNIDSNIVSFEEYSQSFWYSNPITLKTNTNPSETIHLDKLYVTDIDVLSYIMRTTIPKSFLSKEKHAYLKTITNLRHNFLSLFYLNYLHMVYQTPTIASCPVHILFPSITKTTSLHLSLLELEGLFQNTNLSNTKISSVINILTNSTTSLTLVLALSLNQKDFISKYLKFDPTLLVTNFKNLQASLEIKSASLNDLKDGKVTLNAISTSEKVSD